MERGARKARRGPRLPDSGRTCSPEPAAPGKGPARPICPAGEKTPAVKSAGHSVGSTEMQTESSDSKRRCGPGRLAGHALLTVCLTLLPVAQGSTRRPGLLSCPACCPARPCHQDAGCRLCPPTGPRVCSCRRPCCLGLCGPMTCLGEGHAGQ